MPPPLRRPPSERSNMSDLIAIIGSGAGMAALAQKGVGGGRAALFPSPQQHGRVSAPQKRPPCPKHPLPWERRHWACVRPGRKRRKRWKAQPWQPPSAEPSLERGWGRLPMSPGEQGGVGQGDHVRHVQEGTFCFQPSFSQDFLDRLMELTGHPPPAAVHPRRGRDHPKWPQGVRSQRRWHWDEPCLGDQ